MTDQYKEIRPYRPEEMQVALNMIIESPQFPMVVEILKGLMTREEIIEKSNNISSVLDFQKTFCYPLLAALEMQFTDGISTSGIENLENKASLIMTNHRDIVMDSAYMNYQFIKAGLDTAEIGIGNNLLVTKSIEAIVRLNKSFIVKRNLPGRELAKAFMELSGYIRHTITEKKQSVWIAQREGRAKDSNDTTQESILKMFTLSGEGSMAERMVDLHICPTTISYEYDSCDYLKVKEFQQKRDDENHTKSPQDDVLNMKEGIFGKKGRVHYAISPCISSQLEEIAANTTNRKAQAKAVAELCNKQIFENYVIYPINKMAYDYLNGTSTYAHEISAEEKVFVDNYFEGQLKKIDLPNMDYDFCRHKLLEMYANPLINHLAVSQ
ncbi:acyltransferase [Gammaproteobacteria bacterium]|nr:acyltransferase [Gammaproteobacteria bacterium]